MIEDVICLRPGLFSRRWGFALAAAVLFCVEVAIARYAPPGWLRGFVGDVLVVVLVWSVFGLLGRASWSATRLALAALLFACMIEVLQAFGLVDLLGLHNATLWQRVLRIALGATFDPWDFVAYACGGVLCLAISRWAAPQPVSPFTCPPAR
jgi:hypothetical protein